MEKLNFDQMEQVNGGGNLDADCLLAVGLSIGSFIALGLSAAPTAGASLFGIGLWWGSIAAIGFACY